MHVLDYLSDPKCEKKPDDIREAEYRLLSSGTLHQSCLGDYSKSEGARILLRDPLLLFAVSRPFDDYPLEMSLHLSVPLATEEEPTKQGTSTSMYYPDEEVARDLAALLTLRCRRLVTVAGKASERYSTYAHPQFDRRPFPMPLATSMRRVFWRPHPSAVLTSPKGQEVQDYNPRPKEVSAGDLTARLLALPSLTHAEGLVASSRLYALAMEIVHDRPDIAYALLVSAVETIANAALRTYQPPDDLKVEHHKKLHDLALELGLGEETARKLAIEACRREWWATKKFKQFLVDNIPESMWTEQDELFYHLNREMLPKREDFERTLTKVYNARSKATHEGKAFPASATYTGGPNISTRAATALFGSDSPFPPVVWFERVVNAALCAFWDKSIPPTQSPPMAPPADATEAAG